MGYTGELTQWVVPTEHVTHNISCDGQIRFLGVLIPGRTRLPVVTPKPFLEVHGLSLLECGSVDRTVDWLIRSGQSGSDVTVSGVEQ